jgi:molecular chaperone DnaK
MPGESEIIVGQERLLDLTASLVGRTFVLCDEVLSMAGIKPSAIDAVFLSGGASQLPMIHSGVMRYFEIHPRTTLDPMEVVGVGASLWEP